MNCFETWAERLFLKNHLTVTALKDIVDCGVRSVEASVNRELKRLKY